MRKAYRIATLNFGVYPGTHIQECVVDDIDGGFVYFNENHKIMFEPVATQDHMWCRAADEALTWIIRTAELESQQSLRRLQEVDAVLELYRSIKWPSQSAAAPEASVPTAD